jgi:uncharacterized CHY-type Zn-finger protein/energy-coupling factor transporter transmembrane protein EcfT
MISLYAAGTSFLHRAPAGVKFLVLFAALAVVFIQENLYVIGALAAAALVLFGITGLGFRRALRAIRPVILVVVLILVVQGIFYSLERGTVLSSRLLTAVLLAALLTYSTRTTDMLDLVYRVLSPFRRLGVNPWQASLTLSLAITSIPVVSSSVRASREAYKARGEKTSIPGIVVPVAVRLIRSSEAIGDAISARGLDEDPRATSAPPVLGPVIDDETRCVHYHSDVDVVAIRFKCCGDYYPCHACHEETAGHPIEVWPIAEQPSPGILCGVCKSELPIDEYMQGDECPRCGALFNPGCRLHSHLYFEPDNYS